MNIVPIPFLILAFFALFLFMSAVRVLREYERGVVFRLGKAIGPKGPGLILLIPMIDKRCSNI